MILVDTSIWVDHFRAYDAGLVSALEAGEVVCHPFIVGELACGGLQNRTEIVRLLQALPSATLASHSEVLRFIEDRGLAGRGAGYVDVHLLASVALSPDVRLWSRDRRLAGIVRDLRFVHEE